MEKVSKVLNVLYRFRIPIIATIVLIISTSLTMTGVSGKANEIVLENKSLTYGESVQAYGKAIFGNATVEYSQANQNDWTQEIPYRAGNYKARAKSKNGFGQQTYTESVEFSIAPKPLNIKVTSPSITYGESVLYSSEVYKEKGDKIESINFVFGEEYNTVNPFGDKEEFATKVHYDLSSVKILDSNNEDITYCYELKEEEFDISIKKRNLKLVSSQTKKEYDGTPLTNENYYISNDTSLANGDQISFEHTSITDAGSINIKNNVIIKNGDIDRTNFYKVSWDAPGTLTVTKRPLTIKTNSIQRSYNQHRLSSSASSSEDKLEIIETNGLLTDLGHKIQEVVFDSEGTYKPVKNSPNSIASYQLVDEKGNDVLQNYDVTIQPGTINIDPVPLYVTYDEKERYYDFADTPLVGDLTYEGLLGGDSFIYSFEGINEITAIDSPSTYKCKEVSIQSSILELDVTDCYDISYTNEQGSVLIKSNPLSLVSNSLTTIYDSTSYSKDSEDPNRKLFVEEQGLLPGHKIEYTFAREGEIFANGENYFDYTITDEITHADVSQGYNVSTTFGQITTAKRDLNVTFDGYTWTYDGEDHRQETYSQTGLAGADEIVFNDISYPSVNTYTAEAIKNHRTFDIIRGIQNVNDYYNINVVDGDLRVDRKELTINFNAPESKMYDGQPINITNEDVTITGLDTSVFTYDLSLNYYEIKNYQEGGYDICINDLQIYKISDAGKEYPLTNNFSFTYQSNTVINPNGLSLGHVDIAKRPLSISSKTLQKVYDGTPLESTSEGTAFIYDGADLVTGHAISLNLSSSITEVGSIENYIIVSVYDENFNDVTYNYDLSYVYGTLEILANTSASITFSTPTPYTYDGYSHYADSYCSTEYLGSGNYVSATPKTFVDAGTYDIKDCFEINIYNSNNENVTNCYSDITIIGSPFVINKRDLTIDMQDIDYDISTMEIPDANTCYSSSAPADTDTLNLKFADDALESIRQNIYPQVSYTITRISDGADMASNYNVTINSANSIFHLKDLKFFMHDRSFEYTGEIIDYDPQIFWSLSEDLASYGCYIEGVEVAIDGEFKEPGTYTVSFVNTENIKIKRNDKNGNPEDVTSYFNIIFEDTSCQATINKRAIYISDTDISKVYDGTELIVPVYGMLISGHHVEIDNPPKTIINAGTITDVINDVSQVHVKDADGNDVTNLYNIHIESVIGQTITRTINKCNLTIRTPSYQKVFDTTPISISNEILSGTIAEYQYKDNEHLTWFDLQISAADRKATLTLATGDKVVVTYPVQTNWHAHSASNEAEIEILDKNGNDASGNYNLTTQFGTLTINPLEITYTGDSLYKTYDGSGYTTSESFKYSSDKHNYEFIDKLYLSYLPSNVINYLISTGTQIYVYLPGAEGNFMAGTYYDYAVFIIMYNDIDLVELGDIVFGGNPVTHVIRKRNITISNIPNQSVFIDNVRYFSASEELYIADSKLASGDILYIGEEEWKSNKTNYVNIPDMMENRVYTADEISGYLAAANIKVYRKVSGSLVDVTSCYNITFVCYDITVYNF